MTRQYISSSRGHRNGDVGGSRLNRAEPRYDDRDFGATGRVYRGGNQYADSSVDDFSDDESSYDNSSRRDRFHGPERSGRDFIPRSESELGSDRYGTYDDLPTHRGAIGRAGRAVNLADSSMLGRESARRDNFRGSGRGPVSDYANIIEATPSRLASHDEISYTESECEPHGMASGRANIIEAAPSRLASRDDGSYTESDYEPRGMASGRGMGPNRYGLGSAADSDYDEESEYEPRGELRGHNARATGFGRSMSSRRPGRGYESEDIIDDDYVSDRRGTGRAYGRGSGRY